jgi:hypothetical protein
MSCSGLAATKGPPTAKLPVRSESPPTVASAWPVQNGVGALVTNRTTPPAALAPKAPACGPRSTSAWLTSNVLPIVPRPVKSRSSTRKRTAESGVSPSNCEFSPMPRICR